MAFRASPGVPRLDATEWDRLAERVCQAAEVEQDSSWLAPIESARTSRAHLESLGL